MATKMLDLSETQKKQLSGARRRSQIAEDYLERRRESRRVLMRRREKLMNYTIGEFLERLFGHKPNI